MPDQALIQLRSSAPVAVPAMSPNGVPLSPELQDQVRINWYVTKWCNYSCGYCSVLVYHKKTKTGPRQEHAFDHYPVERWVEAFDALPVSKLSFHLTGGEVFLDRVNHRNLLQSLCSREKIHSVSIATNGFWDPDYYQSIENKEKIFLDMGLHPSQTDVDQFLRRALKIREAGFQIAIVNYVVSPENMDQAEQVYERLTQEGLFVLVSTMFPTGNYMTRDYRTDRELEILTKYNTPLDLKYKLLKPQVKGRECFFPAMNYYLLWDGRVQVNCMTSFQNLFEDGFPKLPRQSVPCPQVECIGCTEMYRTLVDEPLNPHPRKLFTHRDLAKEVSQYRNAVLETRSDADTAAEIQRYRTLLEGIRRDKYEARASQVVTPATKAEIPPGQDILGYMDSTEGKFYVEGLSSGRIILGGWVASAQHGTPLSAITIRLQDRKIATIREFYARPDVAAHFGREDWLMCGWLSMVYLPVLPIGEHTLAISVIDPAGVETEYAQWPLRITG